MLPRSLRLTTPAEYRRLFANAATGHGRLMTVRLATADRPQAGVIVSKKTAAKAVDRNRIKRRLRPLLRERLANGPAVRVAVIAKAPAREADNREFAADFQTAFDKALVGGKTPARPPRRS